MGEFKGRCPPPDSDEDAFTHSPPPTHLHFLPFLASCAMIELPVIDLQYYKRTGDPAECAKAAESLHKYGVLCLRDEVRSSCASACIVWTLQSAACAFGSCLRLFVPLSLSLTTNDCSVRETQTTMRSST